MNGPTHELTGVTVALAAGEAAGLPLAQRAAITAAAFASSRWPDVDQRIRFIPHRGPTHTLIACALVARLAGVLVALVAPEWAPFVAAGVAVGYGAHLFADALNLVPVPILWPLRGVRLLPYGFRIEVGSAAESFYAALMGVALLGVAYLTVVP